MERTNRNTWIALGLLALLVVLGLSSLGGGMMMGRGVVEGTRPFVAAPWLWGIGLFALLVRLLLLGGLIVLAVRFFGRLSARTDDQVYGSDLPPVEILKRRYAAGEITREQFEDMRSVLEARA